jgi:hypothetical protein
MSEFFNRVSLGLSAMKKEKDLLEAAMTELHFRAQMSFSRSEMTRVDWREMDNRLREINRALEQDDGVSFKKNYFYLLENLHHSNVTRREFGEEPEDPRQLAPEGTRELLNHIVDTITRKLRELPQPSQVPAHAHGADLKKIKMAESSGVERRVPLAGEPS